MFSPIKPLLCRHDFYWSERHGSDRCRRCGKRQPAEALDGLWSGAPACGGDGATRAVGPSTPDVAGFGPTAGTFIDFQEPEPGPARTPAMLRPSARLLKAEAQERRDRLPSLLDRLAVGDRPSREDAIDAILAVMEDAHSADPVLFGPHAAARFARLHRARLLPGGG